ncbi:hypothetical protein [Citrobacter sp. RHBSTW-00667]|uniref:hypothetical protein n=1 Tax=Citrobacter sp. RHBSTW-00667 TaxID=2742659 RepID=UPI002E0EF140
MMNPVPWLQMTNMISYQGLVRTFPSAMGASVLRKRLQEEGLGYIKVINDSANRVGRDYDMVITLSGLLERAKLSCENTDTVFMTVNNFIKLSDYDETVAFIKSHNHENHEEVPA